MGKHARAFQLLMVENANILQLQEAEISSSSFAARFEIFCCTSLENPE